MLKAKQKFRQVIGIDNVQNRLFKPTVGNVDGIHFVVADVNKGLPFSDSSFDAITCIATLEHLYDLVVA